MICPDNHSKNVENYLPLNTDLHYARADASGVNRDSKLSFEIATVCGNKCKMLCDTGGNTVAVNRSLIPLGSLTGRSVNVRTFCCANRTFQTAIVDLQSDYFTGLVEACVLDNPVADVILGNITGICDQSIDGIVKSNFACSVQTRAHTKDVSEAKSNCHIEENKSTSDVHMFGRFSDFAQRQKEDPTLKAWFDKVGKDCKDGISYVIVDLLHREFSRDEITLSTLAVPQTLRDQVLSYAHEATLAGHAGYYKTLNRVQS